MEVGDEHHVAGAFAAGEQQLAVARPRKTEYESRGEIGDLAQCSSGKRLLPNIRYAVFDYSELDALAVRRPACTLRVGWKAKYVRWSTAAHGNHAELGQRHGTAFLIAIRDPLSIRGKQSNFSVSRNTGHLHGISAFDRYPVVLESRSVEHPGSIR